MDHHIQAEARGSANCSSNGTAAVSDAQPLHSQEAGGGLRLMGSILFFFLYLHYSTLSLCVIESCNTSAAQDPIPPDIRGRLKNDGGN